VNGKPISSITQTRKDVDSVLTSGISTWRSLETCTMVPSEGEQIVKAKPLHRIADVAIVKRLEERSSAARALNGDVVHEKNLFPNFHGGSDGRRFGKQGHQMILHKLRLMH
jgi:hypothetical protein